MPEITVTVMWDTPDDPEWMNADNVAVALNSYCHLTRFRVVEVTEPEVPDEEEVNHA